MRARVMLWSAEGRRGKHIVERAVLVPVTGILTR
jgi:hypothetical protein